MYKLIRRISNSFFPRPDRPWNEDATSNAPQIGRKRRLSADEHDDDVPSSAKKHRRESVEAADEPALREEPSVRAGKDTEGVKEVTKGVREVELDERDTPSTSVPPEATAVPLPDSPTLQPVNGTDDVEEASDASSLPELAPEAAAQATAIQAAGSAQESEESVEAIEAPEDVQVQANAQDEEEVPGLSAPPPPAASEPESKPTDDTTESTAQQDTIHAS